MMDRPRRKSTSQMRSRWRKDVEAVKDEYQDKYKLTQISNSEGIRGGIPEAMKGADVVLALS